MANEKIFISYSRIDKDVVFGIRDIIERELKTKCWIDLTGIESDKQFVDIIISAIKRADIFIFMYSANSAASKWTHKELHFAEKHEKRLVFINIDHSGFDDWFEFHYGEHDIIDFENPDQRAKLITNLKSWLGVMNEPSPNDTSVIDVADKPTGQIEKAEFLYQQSLELYKKKEFKSAVPLFRQLAEQGNADAQCNLGQCYEYGLGVTIDYDEALKWYRKAEEQGSANAQFNLGYFYAASPGATKGYDEAVKWYRKAAEQGHVLAQANLGFCYDEGKGVTRDTTEAAKWYRKAAEQGNAFSQYELGAFYKFGIGVKTDYTEALKWYRKAAEQGYTKAQNSLGQCYRYGYGVTKNMQTAIEWYRKAARLRDSSAQKILKDLGETW